MTESNTETESVDLSFLAEATPVKTTMRTSKRGRQPGKNPLAGHVKNAHDSGDVLSLPVPARVARQTERMARRAALREGWSISVQVLTAHPDQATSDNVVALNALKDLPDQDADVWVSIKVADKSAETASETESADESGDAPADPFAGTPDETESADETPEPDATPRKGRRSRNAA